MSASKIDWKQIEHSILERLNIRDELAGRVEFTGGDPNDDGWLGCRAIGRDDASPSAAVNVASTNGILGRYTDLGSGETCSFWDLTATKLGMFADWKEARAHYADKAGIELPGKQTHGLMEQVAFEISEGLHDDLIQQWCTKKPPITLASVKAAGGKICQWPAASPPQYRKRCLGFSAYRSGKLTAFIIYQVSGAMFEAIGNLCDRKTHLVKGSKDGWVIVGDQFAFDSSNTVWKVEGIPDALALFPHLPAGHVVITNVCGAGGVKKLPCNIFKGKKLNVIGDQDKPGIKGAHEFSIKAAAQAIEVRIAELPYELTPDHGKDVRDFFNDGHTFNELVESLSDLIGKKKAPGDNAGDDDGPTQDDDDYIDAGCKDLKTITAQAWDALAAANKPPFLFRSAGLPARIESDDRGEPILKELNEHKMRHTLARVIPWRVEKARGDDVVCEAAMPPIDVVRDVLATPDMPLPIIQRIVEAPVFAADGTIQTTPGYHPASRTFYFPAVGFSVPDVPERPDSADIESARTILNEELLGDFPFVGDAEKAHAMALMILPFARDLITGPTPLHLFEKPSPGTGATLLVDALTFPATGRPISCMTEGKDEDEWRKRITAKLRGVAAFFLIDNLRRRLDSAAVSSAITSLTWEDRFLGKTEIVHVPVTCAWLATGNNPALSSEISRRTIRCRMDAKTDRPWLRDKFRHPDLRGWMRQNRGLLVWSVLTLIRAWIVAGKPAGGRKLGMFESWADTIGGILQIGGVTGFLTNLETFYEESDSEGAQWRAFVWAWWEKYHEEPVKAAWLWGQVCAEAGLDLGDGSEQSQKIKLGKLLSNQRDKTYDLSDGLRLRVERGEQEQRTYAWKLKQIEK